MQKACAQREGFSAHNRFAHIRGQQEITARCRPSNCSIHGAAAPSSTCAGTMLSSSTRRAAAPGSGHKGGSSSSPHLGHNIVLHCNAAGVDPLVELVNECRGADVGWRKQHGADRWRGSPQLAVEVRLRSIGQEAAHCAAQGVPSDEDLGDLGGGAGG